MLTPKRRNANKQETSQLNETIKKEPGDCSDAQFLAI